MQDIKRQFSLDWLTGGSTPATASEGTSSAQSALDEAILFYSQPLINHLSQAQNHEMYLHDLAHVIESEITNFKFEELSTVIHRLVDLGLVKIVKEDSVTGNHLVQLIRTR